MPDKTLEKNNSNILFSSFAGQIYQLLNRGSFPRMNIAVDKDLTGHNMYESRLNPRLNLFVKEIKTNIIAWNLNINC